MKDGSKHFKFGENWADFANHITEDNIKKAEEGLKKLLGPVEIEGKTFLDIGCGSGLSSLAALNLGAKSVYAVDIDQDSVETTLSVLTNLASNKNFKVEKVSIFELDQQKHGTHDIVYSWGVLHHTGAMMEAIDKAASLCEPQGHFLIALYHQTPLCGVWKFFKCIYSKLPKLIQKLLMTFLSIIYLIKITLSGQNPLKFIREYGEDRGMNFIHDAHDWLGGYPYESIKPDALLKYMDEKGFKPIKTHIIESRTGFWGTACDEFCLKNNQISEVACKTKTASSS